MHAPGSKLYAIKKKYVRTCTDGC
eukprot:COSAG01_NODE_52150_length_348_cov_16.558233_1_plen_23_part_01